MKAKGNALHLSRCLHENQNAYDAGHDMPHSILGLGLGGGYECVRVAGHCKAFEEYGVSHAFTVFKAVSGSAGPLASLQSGVAARCGKMFQHFAATKLIRWDPMLRVFKMDIRRYERALMGEETMFGLDAVRIRAHPTELYVTTTRRDGSMGVIDLKTVEPHPARGIAASCAIPLSCESVEIDGEPHHDGAFCGEPVPIEAALATLRAKRPALRPKVLVLQSRLHPKYRRLEWWMWPWWVWWQYAPYLEPVIARNMMYADHCFANALDKLRLMRDVDWCRIAPTPEDTTLLPTSDHVPALAKAEDEAACFMRDFIRMGRLSRQI